MSLEDSRYVYVIEEREMAETVNIFQVDPSKRKKGGLFRSAVIYLRRLNP